MTEPSRSSGTPTEDVLYAIQEAIDAPRLPFPDRHLRRGEEPDGLEARVTKLEAGIDFQRNIAEIKTELQIMRANARSGFRLALRHFPQSIPLQHSQVPCEGLTRASKTHSPFPPILSLR